MTQLLEPKRFRSIAGNPPLALLAACLLAFGVFLPWLGFYQDDWHFIYYANQGLSRLWELSAYDNRPFASWPYIAGFAVAGFRPLAWQVIGLVLRWATSVAFWLFLRTLWPEKARLSVVAALLFTVYPLYTLQPMAVTYITHWVCYFLFLISLWLMARAVRQPGAILPLLILSVLLDALQLFTIEYFNGVELLRPVILWMALASSGMTRRERLSRTIKLWSPYLLALIAFILWRGFVFHSPAQDTNAPTVFRELVSAPTATITYLIGAALKDSLLILAGAWSDTLAPGLVDFSPAGLAILFLSVVTFAGFFVYLNGLHTEREEASASAQMGILGLIGLLLGPIPAWVTHQPLYDTNPLWNSRLGMASMLGAAMLVTWLVESVIRTPKQRIITYALLLGLATGFLLRWENLYRNAWAREKDFLNQLAWRAPGLGGGTAFVSEGELLSLMGDYPTAFAINMIYDQSDKDERALAWYFPSYGNDTTAEKIADGSELTERKFSTRFTGEGDQILPLWYDPAVSPCLHILTPEDSESRLFSDFLRFAARRSDPGLISPVKKINETIFDQALGLPPNWCTYYQQAELAAQNKDWGKVLDQYRAAEEAALAPTYGAEIIPFIRASLAVGSTVEASQLTETAAGMTNTQALRLSLCRTWEQSGISLPADLAGLLKCGQSQNN